MVLNDGVKARPNAVAQRIAVYADIFPGDFRSRDALAYGEPGGRIDTNEKVLVPSATARIAHLGIPRLTLKSFNVVDTNELALSSLSVKRTSE